MRQLFDLTGYEFTMFVYRPAYWIAYGLMGAFSCAVAIRPPYLRPGAVLLAEQTWQDAGHIVFLLNIFMPLLAGFLTADRLPRDIHSGVGELQRSTPLSLAIYLPAKYMAALAATLLPFFIILLACGGLLLAEGIAPPQYLAPLLLAYLAIAVPAHAFVTAFSLACTLAIPVRVYQVLFTSYWFWGNLISPAAFPTISGTPLNVVGRYPAQTYFGVNIDPSQAVSTYFTPPDARLNLLVLAACSLAALTAAYFYLRRWSNRYREI